ncbi:hypothetical protein ACOME3_010525 [Neoechinorhynchus agilis]
MLVNLGFRFRKRASSLSETRRVKAHITEATPTAETTSAHEPTLSLNRQPRVRFSDCDDVCISQVELAAIGEAISKPCQTSIAGSAISEAELPLSSGDPENWTALGLCSFATANQETMTESAPAIISRYPKKVYDTCAPMQNPELRKGGFEVSPLTLDFPQNEQSIFLESYFDLLKRVALRCSPTLETLNHYEVNASLQPLFSEADYYDLYGSFSLRNCRNCNRDIVPEDVIESATYT